jgi:hypothetical protein
MASEAVLHRQALVRRLLATRIETACRQEFISDYVFGAVPEYQRGDRPDAAGCHTTIVQNDGTGAATLEYSVPDRSTFYAKLYVDASGAHSHRVLKTLWRDGFGSSSRYRVSEPLAFYPEHNMLLVRGATGQAVASATTLAERVAGAREAARWLVRMHQTSARIGDPRYPLEVYHKLMHRIAKASAAHPHRVDEFLELADRFETIALRVRPQFVQSHGQYRHIHVFVDEDAVTVIDLDRSKPADPAKDLGEFVHRMRTKAFKATEGRNHADVETDAFLHQYASALPGNLANLSFYWCYHILVSLWRMTKGSTPDDEKWTSLDSFFRAEFERALTYEPPSC